MVEPRVSTRQPTTFSFQVKKYDLSGLNGISDRTVELHLGLYAGYVKEVNRLREQIHDIIQDGKVDQDENPAYSELTRRLGFEYNGMILHEYYFDNLKAGTGGDPGRQSAFRDAAARSFESYAIWKADFVGIGKMRGVGWAICAQNPATGGLSNHWITLHETGNVAGFRPILVMDVWEHAFILDYKPAQRDRYIEAFFSNIDWAVANERVRKPGVEQERSAAAHR